MKLFHLRRTISNLSCRALHSAAVLAVHCFAVAIINLFLFFMFVNYSIIIDRLRSTSRKALTTVTI
jgi:hypothetical protein